MKVNIEWIWYLEFSFVVYKVCYVFNVVLNYIVFNFVSVMSVRYF